MSDIETDPIEGLVRQALAATPSAATTTDPLAALDRRVRRARRWLAAGAGVASAAVVAAVVVPVAVLSGGNGGEPNGLQPAHTAPPPPPAGTTTLWNTGAISVAATSSGQRWLLSQTDSDYYVGQVNPGGDERGFRIQAPADYVVAGDNVVWVIGGGDGSGTGSRLTAIDPRTADVATESFQDTDFSYAVADHDDLLVVGTDSQGGHVYSFTARSGHVITQSRADVTDPGEIALTGKGHAWVQSGKKLVEVGGGPSVSWPGDIYGPASPGDALWAYDGRLIGLTPKYLQACVSCAEGARVSVHGRPTLVAQTPDGGLFVAEVGGEIDFYSSADLGAGNTPVSASIGGVQASSLTADPNGGVDYVDDQGRLVRWDPAAAGSR